MNVDQGTRFGTWGDETSQLMYFGIMPVMLNGVNTTGRVGDLGGGNGLLKRWIPDAITIDQDASKEPDIVDDVITHVGEYDLVVIRYVLHYLTNEQVLQLFANLAANHAGPVLLIQFVNDDLEAKYKNSVNETKYFRREHELKSLIANTHTIKTRKAVEYTVGAEFYRNRLNHPNPTAHQETVVGYLLERTTHALQPEQRG